MVEKAINPIRYIAETWMSDSFSRHSPINFYVDLSGIIAVAPHHHQATQ
jgi:hypothetical protein